MKYDLKKCNNLNFKHASGLSGFIKVSPKGNCYLYQHDKLWDINAIMQGPIFWKSVDSAAFNSFAHDSELSIVPRDPETYTDWKVGDRIIHKEIGYIYEIAGKLGDIVFLLNDNASGILSYTTILTEHFELVLTDYEKELLKALENKKCPFKEGDKVLVRDSDTSWKFDVFQNYEENACYSYECLGSEYEQCIPLNEHTWQLLGTTDEYKEEE